MTTGSPDTDRRGHDRAVLATVLVVDDSTAIRRILRRFLEDVGYRVTEAADGNLALDACRTDRPDVVLLDMDMPEMDGMATLTAMKAADDLRMLPVLFLTAHTGAAEVAAALEAGAQDFLRKPCEPIEVTARVRTALRLQAQERTLQEQARRLDELSMRSAYSKSTDAEVRAGGRIQ